MPAIRFRSRRTSARRAKLADFRQTRSTEQRLALHQATKIENMFATMQEGEKSVLRLVLKTDVRGSLEAIMHAIHELGTDEVKALIIGSGVGGISESDAMLALDVARDDFRIQRSGRYAARRRSSSAKGSMCATTA